MQNTVYI